MAPFYRLGGASGFCAYPREGPPSRAAGRSGVSALRPARGDGDHGQESAVRCTWLKKRASQ